MNNTYININISTPLDLKEIILAELSDFDILGIIDNQDNLELSFLKENYTKETEESLKELLNQYNSEILNSENIEERNWNEEWEKEIPAIHVNDKIGIAPKWKMDQLTQEYKIEINPKMSFGTGNHATTRLVCKLMCEIDFNDQFWIDAGTGTGILAIAASKFGANNVFAFDNNEWSIKNANENVELNNCKNVNLELFDLDEQVLEKSNGILANILAPVIIRNMEKFYDSVKDQKGHLLLSGILSAEKQDILDEASKYDLKLESYIEEDEWAAFNFKAQ